jgi:hypothetical protein
MRNQVSTVPALYLGQPPYNGKKCKSKRGHEYGLKETYTCPECGKNVSKGSKEKAYCRWCKKHFGEDRIEQAITKLVEARSLVATFKYPHLADEFGVYREGDELTIDDDARDIHIKAPGNLSVNDVIDRFDRRLQLTGEVSDEIPKVQGL